MTKLKYLGVSVTNTSEVSDEIKNSINARKACIIQCRIVCLSALFPKTNNYITQFYTLILSCEGNRDWSQLKECYKENILNLRHKLITD